MRSVALPTASGRIVAAAVGDAHSAFVSDQGELLVCGSDRWLQLGQDLLWAKGAVWQRSPQPVRKLLGTKVVGVACGAAAARVQHSGPSAARPRGQRGGVEALLSSNDKTQKKLHRAATVYSVSLLTRPPQS